MKITFLIIGLGFYPVATPASAVDLRYRHATEVNLLPVVQPRLGQARGLELGAETQLFHNVFATMNITHAFFQKLSENSAGGPNEYTNNELKLGGRFYSHHSADSAFVDLGFNWRQIHAEDNYPGISRVYEASERAAVVGAGLRYLWDNGTFFRLAGSAAYRLDRQYQSSETQQNDLSLTKARLADIELEDTRWRSLWTTAIGYAF